MSGALICCCNILISQPIKFIGNIEYSYETLLPSGIYKESVKTNTWFNEMSYCTQQIQKPIDVDAMAADQLKRLIQVYNKNNIAIDSFEIEKQRRKIKVQMEEGFKKRGEVQLPIRFINYGMRISTTSQKMGDQHYCITDTIGKTDWILLEDTMTIEGLLCQKAKGSVGGKFYDVWFAASIPFAAGPGFMHGLPGIIVSATSEDKKRRYQLTKVEYPLSSSVEFKGCTNEKEISHAEFLLIQEKNRKEREQKREELKKSYQ